MMIKLEKITKIYGKRRIFSDFSFTFPDKGMVCLLGASGSGKSTLLNMISGVDNSYQGTIKFNETDIKSLSSSQAANFRVQNIGYVFQNFNLLNLDTVFNNVLLPLETGFVSKRFIQTKRVNDSLKMVGIEKLAKQRINKLSGGEKQRVSIARAIINDPKVILCDEPTGALDEKNSQEIFNLLKRISKKTLVVVASHDVESVKKIADVIIEIKDGVVKTKTSKRQSPSEDEVNLIGKGEKKDRPYVPLISKMRYAFQKIKAKKFRSIIMNLMLSLALTGIGLSLIITNSVSTKVEESFKAILTGNHLILSSKNENENTFSSVYSTPYRQVVDIYQKYQYMIEGIGVNYLINFEDFFKDDNDFYVDSENKRIPIESLSARNINDFRWISDYDSRMYYPFEYVTLDNDQVILGLSYEDMVNLCFSLQIQRNFNSLGHYIYEKGLCLSLNVANNYWQYDDEQLLNIVAVCESQRTCIYHTNLLWNEVVFEEMMRLPSDDDEAHEFPWEIYKIYYFRTKENPDTFLNASLYDEFLYDFIFERTNYKYNPALCRPYDVCDEKRLYIYSADKKGISGSVVEACKENGLNLDNYYFTSDFGYASYSSNLFSGFSKNVFVSLDEDLLDMAIDADTQLTDVSSVSLNLPKGVVQGNYLISLSGGLRFSSDMSKIIKGRKPSNINEIVVSKGLADNLLPDGEILGNYLGFSGEIEENYDLDDNIVKVYNKTKLLIVGVTSETKNYIYHNHNWTIEFFRDKLGVSSFYLIPKAIVFEFGSQNEANEALKIIESKATGYKIESPIEELRSNIDSTLAYANTILKVFSVLASVISVLLLATTMMLNIIESKNDITLFSLLGIRKSEINSCFVVQSVLQGLISFVISSLELIGVDFVISYMLSSSLKIDFKFSFNSKPVLIIFLLSILVPIFVSKLLLLLLNRKRLKCR